MVLITIVTGANLNQLITGGGHIVPNISQLTVIQAMVVDLTPNSLQQLGKNITWE